MRTFDYVVTVSQSSSESAGKRHEPEGKRLVCLTFSDVTEKKAAEAKIAHMARFDTLTELANRNQFVEKLESALIRSKTDGTGCAVVCFDLDNFKNINDTLGHGIGDQLLCAVAQRASDMLPAGGLIARIGGDEFAVVMADGNADQLAEDYAKRLISEICEPFEIDSHRLVIAASAGIAQAAPTDMGVDDPLIRADTALYRAKAEGGNGNAQAHCTKARTARSARRLPPCPGWVPLPDGRPAHLGPPDASWPEQCDAPGFWSLGDAFGGKGCFLPAPDHRSP